MTLPVAISYSGGSSSEWLVRALLNGTLPRPEHVCVVFADTGAEHEWTYQAVASVEEACEAADVEFLRCSALPTLETALLALGGENEAYSMRADHPPFWIEKGGGRGRAMHRCTRAYKVAPMRREITAWLERLALPKHVEKWIGFALDEAHRATKSVGKQDVKWERLRFPAIELRRTRAQQREDLRRWTGRAPRFSMCVFCPFKSPKRWLQTSGRDLERAIEVDKAIRDLDCIGLTDGPAFLTDRLIPSAELVERGDPQPDLPGLESYCDGGACFL